MATLVAAPYSRTISSSYRGLHLNIKSFQTWRYTCRTVNHCQDDNSWWNVRPLSQTKLSYFSLTNTVSILPFFQLPNIVHYEF